MTDLKHELENLESQIKYHERLYREGRPEITDSEFDELVDRYAEIAEILKIPESKRIDLKICSDHTKGFVQVEHRIPMLSLEKLSPNRKDAKDAREVLRQWWKRRKEDLGLGPHQPLPLIVEPKIDGIGASIFYEKGKLLRVVTRGDGKRGDDITLQARRAKVVPLALKSPVTIEARGEIYWPLSAFEAYQSKLLEQDKEKGILNPRNATAGMMKRKGKMMRGLEKTGIRLFFYQVIWSEGVTLPKFQSEMLKWLSEEVGAEFVYLDRIKVVDDPDQAIEWCEYFGEIRNQLPYQIDGMVIKLEELESYQKLGGTEHHPHWGIAYKFPPERQRSRILFIEVSVGKSGQLTPVAHFEPIVLAKTIVRRATLHNFAELERKDIRVGDEVEVEKAGEIIPRVVRVLAHAPDSQPFPAPTVCPKCETPVLRNEASIYCPNPACPAQRVERIIHFVSRKAMNIKGMGQKVVQAMVEQLGIASPEEIFSLRKEQLSSLVLDGKPLGDKRAATILRFIKKSKRHGLAKILYGLSLRSVGQAMASALASHFGNADRLLDFARRYQSGDPEAIQEVASKHGVGAIKGMGKKTADLIFRELDSPAIRKIFEGLRAAGVSLETRPSEGDGADSESEKEFLASMDGVPSSINKEASQANEESASSNPLQKAASSPTRPELEERQKTLPFGIDEQVQVSKPAKSHNHSKQAKRSQRQQKEKKR
ncbi:MAG: NAD-dependent DNA ligase LigA [Sandaracinaceae bacterium]|nr:NAD-dependent DNA ligase LigA [Sandaracinaceae bacterium]